MYFKGCGVASDGAKALSFWMQSANSGSSAAQQNLGLVFLNGWLGQTVDMFAAAIWLQLAADNGSATATQQLAQVSTQLTPQQLATVKDVQSDRIRRQLQQQADADRRKAAQQARESAREAESLQAVENTPSLAEIIAGAISQNAAIMVKARAQSAQKQSSSTSSSQTSSTSDPAILPSSAPIMCEDARGLKYNPPCVDCNAKNKGVFGMRVMAWDTVLQKCVNGG